MSSIVSLSKSNGKSELSAWNNEDLDSSSSAHASIASSNTTSETTLMVIGEHFTCSNCEKTRLTVRDLPLNIGCLCRLHNLDCFAAVSLLSEVEQDVISKALIVVGKLQKFPSHVKEYNPSKDAMRRFDTQEFNLWTKGKLKHFIQKLGRALPPLPKRTTYSKFLLVLCIARYQTLIKLEQPFRVNQQLNLEDPEANTMETMVFVKKTSFVSFLKKNNVQSTTRAVRGGREERKFLANRVLRLVRGESVPMTVGHAAKKPTFDQADTPVEPELLLSAHGYNQQPGKRKASNSSFNVVVPTTERGIVSSRQRKKARTRLQHTFKTSGKSSSSHGHGRQAAKNTLRASSELSGASTMFLLKVDQDDDGNATGKPLLVASRQLSKKSLIKAVAHLLLGLQGKEDDNDLIWLGDTAELDAFTKKQDAKTKPKKMIPPTLTGGPGAVIQQKR